MVALSLFRITESRCSVKRVSRNFQRRRLTLTASLFAVLLVASSLPANAHQPVNLSATDSKVSASPILVDGTISFAIYASMTTTSPSRTFRLFLAESENLDIQYLILNQKPENSLTTSQLPVISYLSPSGKSLTLKINERTPFYEPFSKKKYLYLSRISTIGEAGIYTITIRAKRSSSVVIAVGSREISGDILKTGKLQGQCPSSNSPGAEITKVSADQLISMSERAAQACAASLKWGFRVVSRDGEEFPVTLDYRMDRVNVTIVSDKVTEVSVG